MGPIDRAGVTNTCGTGLGQDIYSLCMVIVCLRVKKQSVDFSFLCAHLLGITFCSSTTLYRPITST